MPESLAGEPLRPSIRRRDLRRVEYGDERDPAMREFPIRISPLSDAARITKPLFVVAAATIRTCRTPKASRSSPGTRRRHDGPVPARREQGHGFAPKENADFQFDAS